MWSHFGLATAWKMTDAKLERVALFPLVTTPSGLDLPQAPLTVQRSLPVLPPEDKDDYCHERENDRNRRKVQGHVGIPSRLLTQSTLGRSDPVEGHVVGPLTAAPEGNRVLSRGDADGDSLVADDQTRERIGDSPS
jgi:hypothetical protein